MLDSQVCLKKSSELSNSVKHLFLVFLAKALSLGVKALRTKPLDLPPLIVNSTLYSYYSSCSKT
jgi:hypothetical protein